MSKHRSPSGPANDPAARRLRRAIPCGPCRHDRSSTTCDCLRYTAFEATGDIPEAGIRAGDLMLHIDGYSYWRACARRNIRFPHDPVPRQAFAAVARGLENGTLRPVGEPAYGRLHDWLVRMSHSRRWAQASLDSSPLRILRDRWAAVSRPIEATSDDAALFELLAQVGCRMPSRDEAAE